MTGRRFGSTSSRRCSKSGGSESFSPRCSSGSSTVKPGPHRGDLEEHPAGLAEVDRLEVEAVDLRGRAGARGDRLLAPRHVLLDGRGPGDVVDGARALDATLLRRRVEDVEAAALGAARLPAVARSARTRAPPAGRSWSSGRRRVGAHRVEALQGELARDLGVVGDQRRVGHVGDEELVVEPLRVGEVEAVALAPGGRCRGRRGDPPRSRAPPARRPARRSGAPSRRPPGRAPRRGTRRRSGRRPDRPPRRRRRGGRRSGCPG